MKSTTTDSSSELSRALATLRQLIAQRKLLKRTLDDEAVASAFAQIASAIQAGDGASRLEAASILGKAAEISKPLAEFVRPILETGLQTQMPHIGNWGTADERYYLAKAIAASRESWVPSYAAVELALAEAAERSSRRIWAEIAIERSPTLANALLLISKALADDHRTTTQGSDTALRKLNKVAIAISDILPVADLPEGDGFGAAFSDLVVDVGGTNDLESRALRTETAISLIDLMIAVLRFRFACTLDPEIYRTVRRITNWWKPATPPEALTSRAQRIAKIAVGSLHTLSRRGVAQRPLRDALARRLFDDSEAPIDRLIDSIKQYMTLGADVSNLARIRLDEAKDPDQRFSQRDALVLYLAHLMRLTEDALIAKGYSPNIRRRFAHPGWSDEHRQQNENEMKTMMAQAIVLARSLGDRLLKGLPVTTARRALDQLKQLNDRLPSAIIAEPVREATAAGAGALMGMEEHKREAYLILDVGAGTTDIAGCFCVNNPEWDQARVFEVESAASAIKSAGNILDNALTAFVLQKLSLVQGSTEHRAAAAFLNRNKRIYKERLFVAGQVVIQLPTGETVDVLLNEFLAYSPVVGFSKSVRALVTKAALAIAGDMRRLVFVATGGGARLPMVRAIAEEGVEENGRRIAFTWREPAPAGLATVYPDLADPYPQIAVAIGGALPRLPEQRPSIFSGVSDAPKRVMAPSYK